MVIQACAGIVFAIVCLVFNLSNINSRLMSLCSQGRTHFDFVILRLIKLASAKLNLLIVIGAIILYINTIFFVIPTTDPDVVNVFCNLTPWLTAIGYSLCYGTILAKMARVYYIFNNPTPNKKVSS